MVPESREASRDEENPSTIDKSVAPGTEQSPEMQMKAKKMQVRKRKRRNQVRKWKMRNKEK